MAVKNNVNRTDGNSKNIKKIIITAAVCIVLFLAGLASGLLAPSVKEKIDNISGSKFNAKEYINVGDYKSLNVSIAVTQDDIDTEIDDLREQNTIYEQLDGTVKDGDMVYADIVGYVNGKRADDTCSTDYVIIGSGDWLEGFEDALKGAKTGTTAEFTIPVPMGTYGNEEIDGQNVNFKVKVEYICGDSIVPEYTDDFVQSVSDYNTTDEYNEYLRQKLEKENEADKGEFAWTDFMETCSVKKYPKEMMEEARKTVLQGYYDMAVVYGCKEDEVFEMFGYDSEDDFKKTDLEELAQDTVKENLAAQALADLEGISYTEEEYNSVVDEEYNDEEYSSKKEYEKKNRQFLKDTALMKAVKNWLAENISFNTGTK
ncbi:MAG: FKBP-type peptidyl-prolyl cis-trans isomerase [Lachnospiraceae bacterium]